LNGLEASTEAQKRESEVVMTAEFSKGPYFVAGKYTIYSKTAMNQTENYTEQIKIADVSLRSDCAEANARLIAAAPDMYEALEEAIPHLVCDCFGPCTGSCAYAMTKAALELAEKGKTE
jgi:hypothetical protein